MHFKVTDTNVRIQLAQSEIEATVAAAVEVLVPAIATTLYFLKRPERDYPRLVDLSRLRLDFRVVDTDQPDRTFLRHCRVVESEDGDLYIATNSRDPLDRELWKALCQRIKDLRG